MGKGLHLIGTVDHILVHPIVVLYYTKSTAKYIDNLQPRSKTPIQHPRDKYERELLATLCNVTYKMETDLEIATQCLKVVS